jgi:hypothetical protein
MPGIAFLFKIFIISAALLLLAGSSFSEPGFELELKELKKPSIPVLKTRKNASAKKKIKPRIKQMEPEATKPEEIKKLTEPVMFISELTLKAADICQLAERMAVALAHSVPPETLLNGLNFKRLASVVYDEQGLLVTCGMPAAEAYTYNRLLAEHEVQMLNLNGTESAEQVASEIIDCLGLSFMLDSDEHSKKDELIYLFPAGKERERPLRLTIQP